MEDGLIRACDHQFTDFAGFVLGVYHVSCGQRHFSVYISALAHPSVVINLAQITHSGVRQKGYEEIMRTQFLGKLKGRGDAAAARSSGENSFLLDQPPRNDEAFLV